MNHPVIEKQKSQEGKGLIRESTAATRNYRKMALTELHRPHWEWLLIQEVLLREAKITEELNLCLLETYEQIKADKKKQTCPGPIITYHSVAVLLVGEPGPKEENVDVEGLDPAPTASALTPRASTGPINPPAHCSCTFITFSDMTFEEWAAPKVSVWEVCPVTHCPALYWDPVTDIPYTTAQGFKIIHEAYK
ncbi:hypothetical protein GH733_014773 [Mirounga leonina]|nr:hypothetical protein GH733_014773 [Mirounga leonina]